MKWLFIALMSTNLWAQVEIKELPVAKIYIPKGFDSNDASQVIVSGELPNLCYKSPRHSIKRVGNKFSIKVEGSYVKNTDPGKCINISVPFLEEVTLGELPAGAYQIALANGQNNFRVQELVVKEAKAQIRDEHFYADVKFIEESDANRVVKLIGHHPNDCLEIEKVEILSNDADTLSLLPILKIRSGHCTQKRVPFEYNYEVPMLENMARGVLLHVRVMDGRSVNHLFQNKLVDRVPEFAIH